jgi:hypothetical protein
MVNAQSNNANPSNEESEAESSARIPQESKPDDDEFKITVKKLDIPVRPRGVLADG